jgi:hypothetical protein
MLLDAFLSELLFYFCGSGWTGFPLVSELDVLFLGLGLKLILVSTTTF